MTAQEEDRREGGAEVVPLRAADAGTETGVDEGRLPGASYADLTGGRAPLRPVLPEHWRTWEAVRDHYALAGRRAAHHGAYHGLRLPAYAVRTGGYAIWGLFVVAGRLLRWWHPAEFRQLESDAARRGALGDHLRVHSAGKATRKSRGTILGISAACVFVAVIELWTFAPHWVWLVLAAAAVPFLARAGRPAGKPIAQAAVMPAAVTAPSPDVITRALASLGIAGIDKWLRDGRPIAFPSPVREDGPGWRAEIDLPYGVTAAMVIDRRPQLASGLRRPLGAVWPEPVTAEHEGRLELWVGRQDLSKARIPAWPLLRAGQADVFAPVPFGVDVRGRPVTVPMAYHHWLIGAVPRQGKTAAARLLACAAALDPRAELWVAELKGSGDLDPLEQVAGRFISGIDAASIGEAAGMLAALKAEVGRRSARLKKLPRELCPDKRVTRQIAARRSLKLWPLVLILDEAQNVFTDDEHGKQASADAEFIVKIGPAFGVILIIATQRPDAKSLPTGVSGNVSQRFCLKVMGQTENDMILGTSAYKNGIRATALRPEIDAGIGYHVGGREPQVVRCYYLDMPATERVAVRAHAIREKAGTLVTTDDAPEAADILADAAEVFAGAPGLHWPELAVRLAERWPGRYADATAESVSAQLRGRGVPSVVVTAGGERGRGCRLADVQEAAADQP